MARYVPRQSDTSETAASSVIEFSHISGAFRAASIRSAALSKPPESPPPGKERIAFVNCLKAFRVGLGVRNELRDGICKLFVTFTSLHRVAPHPVRDFCGRPGACALVGW